MKPATSLSNSKLNRRQFVSATAAAAATISIMPRHVLGGPRFVAPNDRINVAYVGCGSQGFRQLTQALANPNIRVTAVCDPVLRSDAYPDYGNDELNNHVRKFLGDPSWAKGARGALCGREPGREIVNRYYASQTKSGKPGECKAYADFRELLDKESGVDAVYIMTPDHLHGVIAVRSMRAGKHVITHKPISNVLREVRVVRDTARETGVATQLFCAAGQTSTPALCEWIWGGAIGAVREVHNWSSRPFWPQGMTDYPAERPAVPEGFDWNLWLGPAAERPFHPALAHTVFRGWYDFGTGALGDMGHYSFHQIFEVLKLGSPTSVEASRSQVWRMEANTWHKQTNAVAFPHASAIRWEFPARGEMPAVALHWYDGGMRPPLLAELEADGQEMPDEGMLFVGDNGRILAGFTGGEPRLIPKGRMAAFKQPPQTLPRPIGELEQFIRACRGGQASDANFASAYPFAETILLGTIAVRINKKLRWDTVKGEFTNSQQANKLATRENRKGWEI